LASFLAGGSACSKRVSAYKSGQKTPSTRLGVFFVKKTRNKEDMADQFGSSKR
jgi:hypothetical protein